MKPYHIRLDPDAQPVIHAPRAVPVHLQGMYKEELNNMVELGVLIPVSEPTDWVNSIVLSETTNDRREVTNGSIKEITFNVTEVPGPAMLGCKACEDLGLLKCNCSLETSKQDQATYLEAQAPSKSQQKIDGSGPKPLDTQTHTPLDEKSFLNEFSDCFEGLGTFNMKPYHITLNPDAQPVIHAPRAVPVHLQGMYKEELNNMVELGVLIPHYQSELLGHFPVCLPPQCWRTRYGD